MQTRPLVPLVEQGQVPPDLREAYAHVARSRGGHMPNVFKALANSPRAMEKVAALGEYLRFHSGMDATIRELAIMTVARQMECAYEWTHHWNAAVQAGVPEELLRKVGTLAIEQEPGMVGLATRYARLVVQRQEVPGELIDGILREWGPEGLLELTVLCGYYQLIAGVINNLRVPLEDDVAPRPFNS
jgi:4-carboxymuconolactone decarboxylase